MRKFNDKQNGYQHKRAYTAAGTDTKFKWLDDLEEVLKGLSSFKSDEVLEFGDSQFV